MQEPARPGGRGSVKSAKRTLAVLELVSRHGQLGLTEVADQLGLPRSSAHGLLHTLAAAGWLHHTPHGGYRLGLRAWEVGQRYGGYRQLVDLARPAMDELAAETGETVQLARLDGTEHVYLAISHSRHPMRLASSVGARFPAHATGLGKALLTLLPEAERARRYRGRRLAAMTATTITDPARLLVAVVEAAEAGYARDEEEYLPGCLCLAAPVGTDPRGETGPVAVSVTVPTSRVPAGWPEALVPRLQALAGRIREEAGLLPPGDGHPG